MFTLSTTSARSVLLSCLGCWAAVPWAQAQTETEAFGPASPSFGSVLTFDSYAGDLSTLAGVEVTWQLFITDGSLIIDNDGAGPANGTYSFGSHILVDATNTDVTLLDGAFDPVFADTEATNSGAFSLAGNSGDGAGDYDFTGPDGMQVDGAANSSSGGAFINDIFLAQFVSGTGGSAGPTFDIALDHERFFELTSSGGTEYALKDVTAFGDVSVTYHVVPEPGLPVLAGLGALAMLPRRRR